MPILRHKILKGSGHFIAIFLLQKLLFTILYVQVLKYYYFPLPLLFRVQ